MSAINPLTAIAVVLATAATDAVYVMFTSAVVAKKRVPAATWSSIWYMLSSFAVISYTENWVYVGFAAVGSWIGAYTGPEPEHARTHNPILLPSELVDDKAWIWADLLTGSLWYYANKPAFKIQFTDAETRAKIWKFVYDRGERQYLIQDSEQMKQYIAEIERLGGKLELRGQVDGQPYYLVTWPNGVPSAADKRG